MNPLTLAQARQAHVQFVNQFDRVPSPDELVAFVAIEEQAFQERHRRIAEEESRKFVRVQFHGHSRRYCYELHPDDHGRVHIGDYVQVYSPHSMQNELVRVVELGRGDWSGGTKMCHRVTWEVMRGD